MPKKTSTSLLNKSEATHYLHSLHTEACKKFDLIDDHPDFYSLINENIRNPYSISALVTGYPRGNAGKYGRIDHIRISNRPMFSRSRLRDWFISHYLPTMRKAA